MRQIQFDELVESRTSDEDDVSWACTVCGRARQCPYAAPCASDAREACRSCGDLLARVVTSSMATGNALNLEVM